MAKRDVSLFAFIAMKPPVRSRPITWSASKSNLCSLQRSRLHINLGLCLAASPARYAKSQGRTALWSVAHSAMRPHRGGAPGIPVCPPREHVPPRPLRRIALWSVLRGKTIPPLHSSLASGQAVCLLVSGKPTVKTHTHERGSISSGWPPNQPASRIAKLFGEGGRVGRGGPVREVVRVQGAARRKLLRPASRRLRRP
jgi:hypothetical protein